MRHPRRAWRLIPWLLALLGPHVLAFHGLAQQAAVMPVPREDGWWMRRHERLTALARRGGVDLVFIGDSITEGWAKAGRPVWDRYYAPRKALQLGIHGDRTEHVLWRLRHGNLDGISPKVAVLMLGTNNLWRDGAREIAAGIVAVVEELKVRLPQTKILLLAIFPRDPAPSEHRATLAEASRLASRVADGERVHYLDIGARLLRPDGTLAAAIMPDFLHLSTQGYRTWAAAIEPKLAELLGER